MDMIGSLLLGSSLALLAWWFVHAFALVPEVLLPGPGEVFTTFIDILRNGYRETTLWQNSAATLWRCGAGFLLACLTGVPLGLALAVLLGRTAEVLLFGLKGYDPLVLGAAVAVLGLVILLAAYLPARRAASIAPMEALRSE